jgi:hypothetical protein
MSSSLVLTLPLDYREYCACDGIFPETDSQGAASYLDKREAVPSSLH